MRSERKRVLMLCVYFIIVHVVLALLVYNIVLGKFSGVLTDQVRYGIFFLFMLASIGLWGYGLRAVWMLSPFLDYKQIEKVLSNQVWLWTVVIIVLSSFTYMLCKDIAPAEIVMIYEQPKHFLIFWCDYAIYRHACKRLYDFASIR